MKFTALMGGILGAVMGAGVWYWLETGSPPRDASWAPILVGLLAGLGTRSLAQPISLPLLRGTATAVIALLAMLGTRQFITYSVQQRAKALAEMTPVVPDEIFEDDAATEEEQLAEAEAADPPDLEALSAQKSIPSMAAPKPGWGEQPLLVGASYCRGYSVGILPGKGTRCGRGGKLAD